MEPKANTEHINVAYVANLARLELTREEEAAFSGQLDHVLDYIHQLSEIDVSQIAPLAHPVPLKNIFRPDQARPGISTQAVIENAPASADNQFCVPKIVE